MSISNYLNKIKNAVFGKDVRGAIHDAIKQCYDDASINHDNANMEVKLARGTHDTLNDRLDKSDQNLAQTNAQLSQITLLAPASNDIAVLQNFIDTLPCNCEVKFPRYDYFLEDVLVFKEKKDIKINLIDAKFIQQKHGYGCIEINNCKNVQVVGGHLVGHGNFPSQTLHGTTLHNEKRDATVGWGTKRNGEAKTVEYGGGYLYNCGIGLLIHNGCENVLVQEVETEKFNYSGISVGFSDTSDVNQDITLYKCFTHDNFDNGINVQRVERVLVDNCKSKNNGHPSTQETDAIIDPGYGFTSRLAETNNAVAKGVTVKNSVFIANKRKGIDAHSGLNINFYNNEICDSFHSGIAIVNSSGGLFDTFSIKNNKILNCGNMDALSGDTVGGIIVRCGGDGEVSHNRLYRCAIQNAGRGSWNVGLAVQEGTVMVENNKLFDTGLFNALVVSTDRCWVNKNFVKYPTRTENVQYIFRILSQKGEVNYNVIECGGNGMFLADMNGEFTGNEIEVTGRELLTGSTVNIINRSKYILADSKDVNRNIGADELKTLVCRVKIEGGVASFVDYSNYISSIESHANGIKLNFNREVKPIGTYFTKMSSVTSAHSSNLWQYGLTSSYLIIGVDDELSGYGKELERLKDMILLVYVVVR